MDRSRDAERGIERCSVSRCHGGDGGRGGGWSGGAKSVASSANQRSRNPAFHLRLAPSGRQFFIPAPSPDAAFSLLTSVGLCEPMHWRVMHSGCPFRVLKTLSRRNCPPDVVDVTLTLLVACSTFDRRPGCRSEASGLFYQTTFDSNSIG
jgi:hypothetical protein